MNQQIASITTTVDYDQAQIDLIRQTVASGTTPLEFALFMEVVRRTGLDPFMHQIYAIKRGEKLTIQTGIDGYRLLADRTERYVGSDDAVFDTNSEDHPTKATVTVWKLVAGQRVPFTASARWSEYCQRTRDGKPTDMWARMPYNMLAKCAEALALRKAFPAELSGVYTREEMEQADNPPPTIVNAAPAPSSPLPPTPRALEPDRIGLPLRNAQVLDLMVSLQRFTDADRRVEMASVIEAIESAGQPVTLATVKAELKARVADLETLSAEAETEAADLTDLPVGVRGN